MRKHLLYFSLKYEGDYEKIYKAIYNKEAVSKEELDKVESRIKCKYITIIDPEYPSVFKSISRPPIVLYYYGDISLINDANILAVIGTRKCSEYGKESTKRIVKGLVKYKPVIISGLAEGLDRVAHEEALNNNLKTIGVLGFGIDYYFYPSCNKDIYLKIKKEGLVISEFPNETKPQPHFFLIRNRIIAVLAKGVIVTEASYKSGTMNTVTTALELGKDIFAIPYPCNVHSGCNFLIKQGAKLIESAKDIYE